MTGHDERPRGWVGSYFVWDSLPACEGKTIGGEDFNVLFIVPHHQSRLPFLGEGWRLCGECQLI